MVGVTRSPSLIHPFRHYLIELGEEVVAAETSADDNSAHSKCRRVRRMAV